ncbi:hypothetical protein FRX31_008424 [Thalictrum thalictroides]|uniref:Uncharacterized protein n=1 Tax=Thalictrum thalictroides TaxID=46969 RepID=A0A7J6WX25_THATH|nr:hypothetical protein FRX31_008424 [Thalictrum thalictroides]
MGWLLTIHQCFLYLEKESLMQIGPNESHIFSGKWGDTGSFFKVKKGCTVALNSIGEGFVLYGHQSLLLGEEGRRILGISKFSHGHASVFHLGEWAFGWPNFESLWANE